MFNTSYLWNTGLGRRPAFSSTQLTKINTGINLINKFLIWSQKSLVRWPNRKQAKKKKINLLMHSKRSYSQLYSKTLKYFKINLLRNMQDEKIVKLYRRTEKARINSCVIFLDGKTQYGRDVTFPPNYSQNSD